ncbi:hypothetical protein FWK35_00025823 [Aphis craccivora]|uniref:Uncharacterized protein n=1 Tax=Aphis craccivora TaxID=307492 RepID=A0A6G0Z1N2_APHCR|nr:hypothetical protein FWK35_00025823 [Aphis craccivora]
MRVKLFTLHFLQIFIFPIQIFLNF